MDRDALEHWYTLYGFAVHRRCLRLLGSAAEADDALQEVFLRADRYAHTLKQTEPIGWLYRIADRYCFDTIAARRRMASAHQNDDALAGHLEQPSSETPPDRVRLVAQVLAACKTRVRDAASLYYVDEMTQDEVAQTLGVSRKTVKEKLAQFRVQASRMLGLTLEGESTP